MAFQESRFITSVDEVNLLLKLVMDLWRDERRYNRRSTCPTPPLILDQIEVLPDGRLKIAIAYDVWAFRDEYPREYELLHAFLDPHMRKRRRKGANS